MSLWLIICFQDSFDGTLKYPCEELTHRLAVYIIYDRIDDGVGEVAEWLKAPLSKSGIPPKVGSWVRIPPSPPSLLTKGSHIDIRSI